MLETIDLKRRRLTLIGSIDYNMLLTICVAFDALEQRSKTKPIRVIFSSDGGDAHTSLGIYDRIRACRCPVIFECYGEVMSAGTIILQAADQRLLHHNCTFMIHFGTSSIVEDDTASMAISKAEFEKYIEQPRMEEIYRRRAGAKLTRRKLRELLNKDSFFTAARAVELGLADRIIGGP